MNIIFINMIKTFLLFAALSVLGVVIVSLVVDMATYVNPMLPFTALVGLFGLYYFAQSRQMHFLKMCALLIGILLLLPIGSELIKMVGLLPTEGDASERLSELATFYVMMVAAVMTREIERRFRLNGRVSCT